jgi:hypothetical protein
MVWTLGFLGLTPTTYTLATPHTPCPTPRTTHLKLDTRTPEQTHEINVRTLMLPKRYTQTPYHTPYTPHTTPDKAMCVLLPNNQRQHRTLHIQEDVLPYALC